MNRSRAVLLTLLAAFVFVLAPTVPTQIAPATPQVPLAPNKIPQFAQPLPLLDPNGIPVVLSATPQINMCEYEQTILPPGTPLKTNSNGKTWARGYQAGAGCASNPALLPGSYIGPVIVAFRGTPTAVTYKNTLNNTATTNVQAYQQNTDQTLQ
jgi:hypothetical protein